MVAFAARSTRSRTRRRAARLARLRRARHPTRSPLSASRSRSPPTPRCPRPSTTGRRDRRRRLRRRRRGGHARARSRCASWAPSLFDMSGPTPFTAVQAGFDPLFPRNTLRAYWKALYLDALDDEAIDAIAARALDRPAPLTLVNTFHMGGAIADVDPEATAFASAPRPYMVSIDGQWTDPADDDANVAWVRSAWERFASTGLAASTSTSPAWPTRRRARASTPRSGATCAGWPRSRASTTRTTSSA